MAVTKKTVYVASDGKEYLLERDADAHEWGILVKRKDIAETALIDMSFQAQDLERMWACKEKVRDYLDARAATEKF